MPCCDFQLQLEANAQLDLNELLKRDEQLWRDKSRSQWLTERMLIPGIFVSLPL